MRKKGFTLIELLAVIVILAMISLISIPIVLNIIEKSRKSAFLDSAYGLMESAKSEYMEAILEGKTLSTLFEYPFDQLKFSGKKPDGGKIVIDEKGNIGIVIYNNKWCVKKELTEKKASVAKYESENCKLSDIPDTLEPPGADTTGANKPDLTNGLIPMKWNGSNWIKADEKNSSGENRWYDYSTQMWANAASVTDEYRNIKVGTIIPESAILAYFVWIPRYEYQYTNLGDSYAGGTKELPGEIKINFIDKSKTSPSSDDYKVHPAFTFGEKELSGIWVGKFETTGTGDNPTIKPNESSLVNQNISTQFATSQKFSASGNTYGISEPADAHMMKNNEWGAVAYLSQSKYGKYGNASYTGSNKEIYINNNRNFITGCSGGSPSAKYSTDCVYTYEKASSGTGASTTGTIYGIYDMNGGTWEHVMGVFNNTISTSGFSSLPDIKYYDNYTTVTETTACSGGICYGHALSETSRWYSDYVNFVSSSYPWFIRGGDQSYNLSSGMFSFSRNGGNSNVFSFRVVLLG